MVDGPIEKWIASGSRRLEEKGSKVGLSTSMRKFSIGITLRTMRALCLPCLVLYAIFPIDDTFLVTRNLEGASTACAEKVVEFYQTGTLDRHADFQCPRTQSMWTLLNLDFGKKSSCDYETLHIVNICLKLDLSVMGSCLNEYVSAPGNLQPHCMS